MRAPTESAYILWEDGSEAGTTPASARNLLTRLARILLFCAALMVYGLSARPTYAERSEATAATFVQPHYCNDASELAGVTNAEAGAQPNRVRLRVMQVLVNEAESRGLTFCALSNLTNFSAVPAYARKYPASYQASRYAHPPAELLQMAADVLAHRYADITEGMGHFGGSADGMRILFTP